MKISIVVPVYNCEKYLGECIESVLMQSCPDWELILVNDGSTDKSVDICRSYSEKYPDKIFTFHKQNEGQFLARKYGILKCTGDYIGFLDADDLLDKNYVRMISENICEYGMPDALCFGFFQFDKNSSKNFPITESKKIFITSDDRKTVYKMIVEGQMPGSLCSKVFKKNIISDNIPDEKIVKNKRFAEDAYHSFDALAKSDSILLINKSLYYYRNNDQGFSQGFDSKNPDYFSSKYLFELLRSNLEVMGLDDSETLNKLCERNFNETVYYMLKYLRASKTRERKKEIIDFDWSAYLLEETIEKIKNNAFRKTYMNVWDAFSKKKYLKIFLKEKFKRFIGW